MDKVHKFLSYNEWDGDYHKGFNIDHKGLTPMEIQQAIDMYSSTNGILSTDIKEIKDDLKNIKLKLALV